MSVLINRLIEIFSEKILELKNNSIIREESNERERKMFGNL